MPPVPLHCIPARTGIAVKVPRNCTIKIINTHGKQVVDFWALNAAEPNEHLSMAHTHGALQKLTLETGDIIYSSLSTPMAILTADTTPGVHDTLVSPCDAGRYRLLGAEGYHASCTDNYVTALQRSKSSVKGPTSQLPPAPLNLFMNVKVNADGTLTTGAPESEAGQYVCLMLLMDSIVVMSACPMDLRATNNYNPTDVHFIVLDP